MPRFLPFFLSFIALFSSAHGQFTFGAGKTASQASLVSEVASIRPGQPFTVALELKHPKEWHSYYRNSGGVELPPAVKWTLPEGFSSEPIQWPTPSVKEGLSGKSFIYSGSPVFLIQITPPTTLATGGTVTLSADASWQICKESCINENKSFTLTLPVEETARIDETKVTLFSAARATLPRPATGWKTHARSTGNGDILLRFVPPAGSMPQTAGLDFIPDVPFLSSISGGGSVAQEGDALLITLKRQTIDFLDQPIPQGREFSGVLITAQAAFDLPSTPIETVALPATTPKTGKILETLGFMFLGGLILNLMPCVFPVIGLKIMGFVQQSGQDRRKIALHGLIFTLGVFASFAVISGILFAAREAADQGGQTLGWGYQLQNPWVVLCLMVLMFVLALNMYGVFEIGASATSVGGSLQTKNGLSGSFFSGVLATVVATPCSAPFLGVAIGAAIAFPATQFFMAFGAMALGLSTPYLLLSTFPTLIDRLPRPGAWMESFKQGMSFLLFATAGFLLWIYAGQIGLENLLSPIFGLSAIALATWIYGRWNVPYRSVKARRTALLLALLFAGGGLFLSKPPAPSALVWEKWSEERVAQLTAEGKPVYIDFTAQWCATCQVNKKRAYTEDVVALIRRKGIVTLKADKTNPDPRIEKKLQELGRSAIPVNVLIVPGKEPIITPEILSSGYLKALFEKEVPAR